MFIGREKELKVLENQYRSGKFEFTVLYGRRRIGKTHLLKQFMVGKKAIYYMATESGEISNLELLSKTVLQNENKGPKATFSSYEDLFDYVGDLAQKERLIFVIDEYPYLAESWPAISSVIQKYCDHLWKGTRLHLILCGSSMSFMENQVLGAKSPLYGRRTAQIKLKEFNYFETEKFLKGMDKETIATLHCATGGVAEYLTYVDKKASLESNLVSLFLTDTGRLYEEPMNYLKQELREPKVYNNILDAIARGASRNNDIAMKVHLASGALNKDLQQLIDLGIVVKETPVGGKSNRKSIYRIRDGSFRFWYRFVFPNSSVIQLGQGQRLYREYKSNGGICAECPYLSSCTESKNHVKVVTRHIWEDYMEICEDIRHTEGMKDWYARRKETIERVFGTAKEYHGMRYTRYTGKALMEMKVGLTFACINLKKLAKMKRKLGLLTGPNGSFHRNFTCKLIFLIKKKIPSVTFAC